MKLAKNTNDGENTYDHIVKYIGLFGGVQGLALLIGVIRNKVAAYFLGAAGIGLINIYNKVSSLVSQTTNLGISFSAVKHVAELSDNADDKRLTEFIQTVRVWSLITALFGLLVGIMLSPLLSWWTFKNYDYAPMFCILALIVPMMAVTGGEMAILKGIKQLKKVAAISVFSSLSTLLLCVPLYFVWGISSVLYSLVISNAIVMVIHLHYSNKVFSWNSTILSLKLIKAGIPMAKLGIAFVLTGVLGQGTDYLILASIQNSGGLEAVGFYNTGYFFVANIGSLLFVAVEADYFPRLSASSNNVGRTNEMVNRQIEACVLLMAPCLMLELLFMPVLIPLLYTAEFAQSLPMAVYGIFYLFFKAMTLPVAYLALAKGDSKTYLAVEVLYDIFIAVAIPVAFHYFGLPGVGVAMSLAGVFDFLLILILYSVKYKYRMALRPLKIYLFQFLLLVVCVCSFATSLLWVRLSIIICALSVSAILSYHYVGRETKFVENFICKLKNRFRGYE